MVRPRTRLLSRELIIDTALGLIGSHHDFTITGLAKTLSVNPSSLYHHFGGGKEEIIDALRERIYKSSRFPDFDENSNSWNSALASWIRSSRESFAEVPAAIPLLLGRVVDDSPTLHAYEKLASILTEAGVPSSRQIEVITLIDAIVLGSAVDSFSPNPLWKENISDTPHLHRAIMSSTATSRVHAGLEMGILAITAFVEVLAQPARLSSAATSNRVAPAE
ncbi:TetR/AcrR family transcriptional regulator [Rhodococcus erythropolis]|uniref:TetR/AcrR family transcriptional regulator n=1 Tax=Rhodococcus erythropolis TaxID=1833 RepID=UPI003013672B